MVDLRLGDCLELMEGIPDGSVDMILCDLPYGTTRNKWDSVIPLDKLWEQYKRVCKENAAIVLNSDMPFTAMLVSSNLPMFRYQLVWCKEQGSDFLNANRKPMKAHETIEVFYKKLPTYNKQMWQSTPYKARSGEHKSENWGKFSVGFHTDCKDGKRNPTTILRFKRDKGLHPTQKPVALLEYLIRTYTNEGETVLDNCMGSGSTGVACVNTGRNFIGIELDEGYFNIAKKRIEEAQAQSRIET